MTIGFMSDLLRGFQWVVCYYFDATYRRVEALKQEGKSQFVVRNESQTFFARSLSLAYGEVSLKILDVKFNSHEIININKITASSVQEFCGYFK